MMNDTYNGDGLNLYAYCANLPVGYEDPSGHAGTICDKKVALLEKRKEEGLNKKEQRQLDKYYEAQAQGNKKNNDVIGKKSREMARAIQVLKSMGIDVEGARQATTLPSCDACSAS